VSRTKSLFGVLVVLAALAVGASSASTPSAFELTETPCGGEAIVTYCWATSVTGELLQLKGTETISTTILGESLLEVAQLEVHLVCKRVENAATSLLSQTEALVRPGTISNLVLKCTDCAILPPFEANCKVKEPIETTPITGTVTDERPVKDLKGAPVAPPEFTTFVIESKAGRTCPATLTSSVGTLTGEQLCNAIEAEDDSKEHLIECLHTDTSTLLFATKPATFELKADIALTGADKEDFRASALG
jgi:hypothetical protein